MSKELVAILTNVPGYVFQGFALWLLIKYSLDRKHQIEKPKNLAGWIYYLRIEIIFAGVLIPQWADWLPKAFEKS